jgi:hypothetical protein
MSTENDLMHGAHREAVDDLERLLSVMRDMKVMFPSDPVNLSTRFTKGLLLASWGPIELASVLSEALVRLLDPSAVGGEPKATPEKASDPGGGS